MSPAVLAGLAIGLFGMMMAMDAKSFGMKTATLGVIVAAAGGFLALFGYYGGTQSGNRQGSGRKVRDHSV